MVIWLIGLSGSGKSTLGTELARQWRVNEPNTVLLDGDDLRKVFAHNRGDEPFTLEGRKINAERITALCELLDHQDINVVCCILSVFPEMRAKNRQRFKRYFEVFMDAPMEVLKKRDVKGLYASAQKGDLKNVVGVDIPFERPTTSDMTIDSSAEIPDIQSLAKMILERIRSIYGIG